MSLKLTYITIEFINTPFIRCGTRAFITTCPLAEDSCCITVLLHDFRENDMIFIVWFLTDNGEFVINPIFHGWNSLPILFISTHMSVSRMLPRHQRSTGRGAHRTTGIGLSKQHTFGCHTIYIRRFNVFLSVAPQIPVSHVIAEDKDNVRFGILVCRISAQSNSSQQACS